MMKRILFPIFLSSALMLSAAAPAPSVSVPGSVRNLSAGLQKRFPAWRLASARPLSETVKGAFAADSWRVLFERPFENTLVSGAALQNSKKTGELRNSAEIIFVKNRPGGLLPQIRRQLRWLASPQELYTVVHYLGVWEGFDVFARADIGTLAWLGETMRPAKGDSLLPVYAAALNEKDFSEYSRRLAPVLIAKFGNDAIPHLRRELGIAIAEKNPTAPHLLAFKNIGTKESVAELRRALASPIPEIVSTAADVFAVPPYLPAAKEIYLKLLSEHRNVEADVAACTELKCEKEALPVLYAISKKPQTFAEAALVAFAVRRFETGKKDNPELDLSEQIRLLMLRTGDTANSPLVLSISEKAAEREFKLSKEELKRTEPLEKQLAASPDSECAIAAALSLVVFSPSEKEFRASYTKRVNETGMRILRAMPKERVRQFLRRLVDNVESRDESNFFSSVLNRIF